MDFIVGYIIFGLVICGLIAYALAKSVEDPSLAFLLGFLLGPVGVLIVSWKGSKTTVTRLYD